jgi:hypothetical protein
MYSSIDQASYQVIHSHFLILACFHEQGIQFQSLAARLEMQNSLCGPETFVVGALRLFAHRKS